MSSPTLPLDQSRRFTLDTSGVAGVLGGQAAVSAMGTVQLYPNGRFLGWYNSPGSHQLATLYGHLAKSKDFCPGVVTNPAMMFAFASGSWMGPRFRASHSGTVIEETGHLAALFLRACAALEGKDVEGRNTRTVGVTIAELDHVPAPEMDPRLPSLHITAFAGIPISVSIASCVACGVFEDWYSFSLILLGILTSGISCLVIGSAKFVFTHPKPAKGCPPGDGILVSDNQVIILRGEEGAVNSVTRGRFSFELSSDSQYGNIELCSFLLTFQSIAQLLLVPQCSLFGQVMFVTSLGVSWIYNSWLSSLDREKIQRDILMNNVLQEPVLTKYNLGTRTTMVVFVLLVLQLEEPNEMLNELLPNDTKVWRRWKEAILRRLRFKEKFEFVKAEWELDNFTQEEKALLQTLYGDAQAAYRGYLKHSESFPSDSFV